MAKKMKTKPKMTLKKWESSSADKKADAKAVKAINKGKMPKKGC